MEIGLSVEFDGKKNVVMNGDFIKEYPIGGMICEYARLRPTEIKPFIMENPYFQDTDLNKNGGHALMSLYESLKEKFDVVAAVMVLTDISNFLADFNRANEEELSELLAPLNADKDTNKTKIFILENSGYDEFGINTIGQALLSAYAMYAVCYAAFKHCFNMLVSGQEYEEEQVMAFWEMYAPNMEFQHIGFHIVFFDHAFHSIYTIESSMSLILFEAAHALDGETKFVKCKNCGEYFVPVGRSDAIYCGYPSPQEPEKACRDVGAKNTRVRKMKSDASTQEYRRMYMRLKMAVQRHPENIHLKQQLTTLTSEMKELRKKHKEGIVSLDDILEWLHVFEATLNGD